MKMDTIKSMNSFDRFDSVLHHQRADKVPFYFPTISCSVAAGILGRDVPAGGDSLHFKEESAVLKGKNAHKEFIEEHHEVTIELNRKLNADVIRETWRSSDKPSKFLDGNTLLFELPGGERKIKRFFPENQSYGVIEDTTKPRTIDQLKTRLLNEIESGDPAIPSEDIFGDQLKLRKLAEPYFPTIFNAACPFIAIDDSVWLMASVVETALIAEYILFKTETYIKHLRWAAENGFNFILGGSDAASSSGPIISPEIYSKLMLKPLKMINKVCIENGMVYCYRSDGNMWKLMETVFSKTGIGSFGEVDRDAGMTVEAVKNSYPNLIILGNISSAVLHKGTEEQVRSHTAEGLRESNGFNYIAGPSNMIMHGTPVENVYAMVDEIDKFIP
ncbi:MAG: uroporphyrinogen decarboxylase family protein [Clostridia bacterium]|nr:uroporphyrinogen decarboxylase family protein [Clostridia bacterium]